MWSPPAGLATHLVHVLDVEPTTAALGTPSASTIADANVVSTTVNAKMLALSPYNSPIASASQSCSIPVPNIDDDESDCSVENDNEPVGPLEHECYPSPPRRSHQRSDWLLQSYISQYQNPRRTIAIPIASPASTSNETDSCAVLAVSAFAATSRPALVDYVPWADALRDIPIATAVSVDEGDLEAAAATVWP